MHGHSAGTGRHGRCGQFRSYPRCRRRAWAGRVDLVRDRRFGGPDRGRFRFGASPAPAVRASVPVAGVHAAARCGDDVGGEPGHGGPGLVWPAVAFLAVAGLFETRVRHDPAGTAAVAGTGSPGQAARRRDVQASGRPGVSRDESSPVPVAEPAVSAVPVSAGPGRDRIVAAAPGRPRRSGSGRGAAVERMREYWVAERDAGRTPTGVELARLTGTDSSFGRRVRRQLLEEAVQQLGREADDAA